ncbi:MAG: hypothetical protein JSV81_04770, partial [Anaerolineales bacterium]
WSFGLSWLLMQVLAGVTHAWQRTGLEFGPAPEPVGGDDQEVSLPQAETPPLGDEVVETDEGDVPEELNSVLEPGS